jgi:ATP-dependent DNA helicase RecG
VHIEVCNELSLLTSPSAVEFQEGQKLIEGRSPNYYISAKVADWAGQKARYIRNRALDDDYYKRLVVEYLQKFKRASRKELNDLLLPKLSDALTPDQKTHKVRNLIQFMRRDGIIRNSGTNKSPAWILSEGKVIAKKTKEDMD